MSRGMGCEEVWPELAMELLSHDTVDIEYGREKFTRQAACGYQNDSHGPLSDLW